MANRVRGYGMTADVTAKLDAKYSEDDEQEVVAWMCEILGEDYEVPDCGRKNVHAWMKDGCVLVDLMNKIVPDSIPKCNRGTKMAFKHMENISFFLKAIEEHGVKPFDLFQTVDLYEDQNMAQVLTTLRKLSSVCHTKGFQGPNIGVKVAAPNKRELDEAKLREGRTVIGLQMGTNQVASQRGMTAYGLGRQVAPSTK